MICITPKKIAIQEVCDSIYDKNAGGYVNFIGSIRDEDGIKGIEYQSYLPLAEKQIRVVAEEASVRWPVRKISVVHRVGWVPPDFRTSLGQTA